MSTSLSRLLAPKRNRSGGIPRGPGEDARPAHVVVGAQLAGLEDDLEVGLAARRLHGHDLVEDRGVVAGEERAAVDDHVDLVRPGLDRPGRLRELDLAERLLAGETGGDAG